MIVNLIYLSLFLMSILALYMLLRNIENKRSSYYVVLFTLISIVCLAYYAYSDSKNADMALVANKFSYLDGTFVLLFFLYCVLDICGIKLKDWIIYILTSISLVFLGLAFTIGKNTLMYRNIKYGTYMGSGHLEPELGPMYNFYVAYVILVTLAPIAIVIYAAFNNRKISIKYTLSLGLIEVCIVAIYFIQEAFDVEFDLLPFGYVLMEYVILSIVHRIALYDGTPIVLDTTEKGNTFGYIIFDTKKAYVGSNKVAKYFFPELESLAIDRTVDNEIIKSEFVDKLDKCIFEEQTGIAERQNRIILYDIKPYNGKKDNLIGYIVELRDNTKQQKLIGTLNEVNIELEKAVDSANSANRAKSDFLANMSHEIRTPINAILGMNEIALRECEDEKLIPYLNDIRTAGNNLLFIINDILDFSKIEAGKIEIIKSDYNLCKTIKEVKDLIEIKALEKNLKFVVNVDSNLPKLINGDENRIRQIVINILNNAVKYTREGSVTLNVKYLADEKDGFRLIISVEDTGIGIKPEDLHRLFDSFSRLEAQKNKGIEGTGLGLAITKKLVEIMQGSITVDSVFGKGTTFTVVIPQDVIDNAPVGDFATVYDVNRTDKENVEHINASNMSILIVDDTKLNLTVAKGLLKPTKAMVDVCTSGRECLDIIAKKHYDVILLDHMMPEMDGIETLKRAKELSDSMCEDSIFIALTANAINGVRDMFFEEGFDDYISKPINPKHLESVLQKYNRFN